ncbi:pantothenate kinase 1 [Plasmodium falciparum NF54]|uniref:Pantothenate kinase 1, putative n=2 Tax=Plasmodium falciparum TaxID=5833 RepID=Q8ILP4_PLAF7|nr:pantothenate kinase 1, putative [Plasmodium falciparum 3D7]KAF4329048.1 pantothenate kinase 1 [Plasmodium falciparum NF54]PKC49390.1 pantothenate kinase 1 [Plasmodium falciparum NF54]CZT99913.1 pantothenate kinase 1, putative [Plasmodium falciparum 3D7]|eukprot:XP_001348373.2 pantothenate kinase, putative [Plasmodium falciparum 3D7]
MRKYKNELNISNVLEKKDDCCSLDIGGTLIKVVYVNHKYIHDDNIKENTEHLMIKMNGNKNIYLTFFDISKLDDTLYFLLRNNLIKKKITLTGGGAHKYFYHVLEKALYHKLGMEINKGDNKIYVSKYLYDEKLSIFSIFVCSTKSNDQNKNDDINNFNSKIIEGQVLFDKKFVDKFPSDTIKIYVEKRYFDKNGNNDDNNNDDDDNNDDDNNNNDDNNNDNYMILTCSRKDEMNCIMNGIHTLFSVDKSFFRYERFLNVKVPVKITSPFHPFIIANIGSGISILKSNGYDSYQRIAGTAIGGGTLMGLAKIILDNISFEELIKCAEDKNKNISFDLKMKHIIGDAPVDGCTHANTLASCFGCLKNILKEIKENNGHNKTIHHEVAKGLIQMVSYNIGYMVYLLSKMHNVKRIFFSGKYISNNEYIMESLTHGVYYYYLHFNSKMNGVDKINDINLKNNIAKNTIKRELYNVKDIHFNDKDMNSYLSYHYKLQDKEILPQVLFPKHDGFLGALGCFFLA